MGVGVQGEAGGEVAEHAADRLDVNAILQSYGRKGMAEVVESHLWDTCSGEDSLQHIVDAVRRNGTALRGGEDILIVGFCFLCFKNFYRLL